MRDPTGHRFGVRWRQSLEALLPESRWRVVAAVSGGRDSVVLAHLLRASCQHPQHRLVLGHVNHHLRAEADAEESFVRELAMKWALPLHVAHVDARRLAREQGWSLEQAARVLRYQALESLCREARCRVIAVGHHMDDQAETLLVRLLRGAGPRGLGAIAPSVLLPKAEGRRARIRLIRPLLGFRRAEIEALAVRARLDWVEDPSNRDRRHLRNRIRHELLPQLASYNPRIVESLAELARWQRLESELVERAAQRARRRWVRCEPGARAHVLLDARGLAREPDAVATRVLWNAYQELAGPAGVLEGAHVRELERLLHPEPGAAHAEVHLPGRVRARRSRGRIAIEYHDPRPGKSKGKRRI
jgi:tRNA(Ile)-lysidine synthase